MNTVAAPAMSAWLLDLKKRVPRRATRLRALRATVDVGELLRPELADSGTNELQTWLELEPLPVLRTCSLHILPFYQRTSFVYNLYFRIHISRREFTY